MSSNLSNETPVAASMNSDAGADANEYDDTVMSRREGSAYLSRIAWSIASF